MAEEARTIAGRTNLVKANGMNVIDDCYNANPVSMEAALDVLSHAKGRTIAVLGDMGELGDGEVRYHKELGKYIYTKNPEAKVITIGSLSKNISDACNGVHFEKIEDALEYIRKNISKETKLFLKASRSMKFERIIELLK